MVVPELSSCFDPEIRSVKNDFKGGWKMFELENGKKHGDMESLRVSSTSLSQIGTLSLVQGVRSVGGVHFENVWKVWTRQREVQQQDVHLP